MQQNIFGMDNYQKFAVRLANISPNVIANCCLPVCVYLMHKYFIINEHNFELCVAWRGMAWRCAYSLSLFVRFSLRVFFSFHSIQNGIDNIFYLLKSKGTKII